MNELCGLSRHTAGIMDWVKAYLGISMQCILLSLKSQNVLKMPTIMTMEYWNLG